MPCMSQTGGRGTGMDGPTRVRLCFGRGATKSSCGVFQQGFPFSGPQLYLICEMGVGLRSPLLPGLASLKTALEGRYYYHSLIGGGKKRRKKT